MKVSKRQKEILYNIFEYDGITVEKLAKILKISPKTISKEITKLNIFFENYETEISLKDKKGLRIESIYPQADLLSIISENQQLSTTDEIKLFLLLKDKTSVSEIEDLFLISRPTVNKVVNSIKDDYLIYRKDGKLKSDLAEDLKISYSLNIVLNYIDTLNYRVTFKSLIEHLGLIWRDEWYTLDILSYVNDSEAFEYTDQSLVKFYIAKNLMLYFNNDTYDVQSILKIKDEIKLDFSDEKVALILEICKEKLKNFLSIQDSDLYLLTNHLVNISKKEHAYKQNEIYVYLKYLEDFKKRYPLTIHIAQTILEDLDDKLNIYLDDYEKYFIALHIQVLFDNNKNIDSKKVLIVCEYGIGLSNFLKARLEQKVKLDMEIKSSSVTRFIRDEEKYKDYHLIVTTVLNLKSKYNTVIHVSPFLIDSEILKVQKHLERIESFITFKNVFKPENLIFTNTIKSKEEAYICIHEKIQDKVYENYMESLINRDKGYQIPLNKMIFPHGNSEYVKESTILIFVLENEIDWNGKAVSIIIFNCLNQTFVDKNTQFIKYFYRMLVNDKNILKILDYNNKEKAYTSLINEIKESND